MKYRLPRQVINQDLIKIISKEMIKQKLSVSRLTKNNLKEIAQVLKEIEKNGLPKNLVCKKLPHQLGFGIFLRTDAPMIRKGQMIGPYAGEVSLIHQYGPDDGSYAFTPIENIHLNRNEQQLFDPQSVYRPNRLYSMKVDARKKGNFTRFINHSEHPNVVAYQFKVSKNSYGLTPAPVEVIYLAKKNIQPGEQLLVCYEDGDKSYWGASKIKPFPMTPKTFRLNKFLLRTKVSRSRNRHF